MKKTIPSIFWVLFKMAASPVVKSFSLREFFDRERNLGIILMLPGAFLLIAFMAYPFCLGIWFSLTDSMIGRPGQFIGLRNFVDLLSDTIFHQTAKNTLIYALVTVPFKAMLGLGLALVLNRRMRL
ncbi:MAG: sugar ABC transporter permease, partial [Proteobacteria bacterium]|nr:sugar ABC transporter permease [Pseudomonadota bacterium]